MCLPQIRPQPTSEPEDTNYELDFSAYIINGDPKTVIETKLSINLPLDAIIEMHEYYAWQNNY